MPHQYINPCHFPLPNNTHVSAPSIAGAVTGAPHRHLPPHLRHVPQLAYATNSKWNATLGRNSAIERPVTFDSPGSVGVRMIYLHPNEAHLATVLQGANDPVVLSNRAVNITFRILWPGYEHVDWSRTIRLWDNARPITRGELAVAIAEMFSRYVEKTQYKASSYDVWRLGTATKRGIGFENIVLLSLRNVFEDTWQADVASDRPFV